MLHQGKYERLAELINAGFTNWSEHGFVRVVDNGPLLLFNYTNEAQWADKWTWLEIIGRGLVYDRDKKEWAVLPLPKFFNWGQGNRFDYTPVRTVTQKVDGWIGLLYRQDGQYKVCSRGSFTSEGADVGSKIILQHSQDMRAHLPDNITLVFEIISPETRIVVDYGGVSKLVVIAGFDRINMRELSYAECCKYAALCGFEITKSYDFDYVEQVEAWVDGLDSQDEGAVILFESGNRFKFKSKAYLQLHRLLGELSPKVVAEMFFDGKTDDLVNLPAAAQADVDSMIANVRGLALGMSAELDKLYAAAPKDTQKDFALFVTSNSVPSHLRGMLFQRHKGMDTEQLLKKVVMEAL